jgi:hypothetical protein
MLFFHFRSDLRLSSATAPLDCAVSVLLSALGVVGMVYAILKGYVMGLKAYGCRNKDANRWCCGYWEFWEALWLLGEWEFWES